MPSDKNGGMKSHDHGRNGCRKRRQKPPKTASFHCLHMILLSALSSATMISMHNSCVTQRSIKMAVCDCDPGFYVAPVSYFLGPQRHLDAQTRGFTALRDHSYAAFCSLSGLG